MKRTPELSVCIPVYNAGGYLRTAIHSILNQDFTDFELLVVDDNSIDHPELTVAVFDDARLRFVRNEHNLGLPKNWNRCIEQARGEFIAIFHQDDLMLPGNLHSKIRMLRDNPEVGFVYSDILTIDSNGQTLGGHYIPQPEDNAVMPGCSMFQMVAETGDPVACPAVVVRASCYAELGHFDTQFRFATDLEMWLRIAAHHTIGFIAQPLIAHRLHDNQEGARFHGTGRDYQDVFDVLGKVYTSKIPTNCGIYKQASYRTLARQSFPMARWKLRQGRLQAAKRYAQVGLASLAKTYIG